MNRSLLEANDYLGVQEPLWRDVKQLLYESHAIDRKQDFVAV